MIPERAHATTKTVVIKDTVVVYMTMLSGKDRIVA